MTPKTQSEVAQELWEKQDMPEQYKEAFIAGALSAMQRVQNECYVKGVA